MGLWIESIEGAKFWMKLFNDLRTRGVGEALGAVFPATSLQMCIVHLIHNRLDYASWKDRKTPGLGQGDLLFRISPGRARSDRRDQRYREHQLAASQNHQDPRALSQRRRRHEIVWLALRNIKADRGRAAHDWKVPMNQFAILYADRFTQATA